ncbi:MAG TPA: aminotransferase class V-fold PLP-dependent enzyme, partial [Candidatus Melainabacteria bacterium]|nr:aminotransferase class V-fold PLP-dependent enzyme [Candidatus Melainabacteria bacterium]
VSVMHANNETGVLQPVAEISKLLEDRECFFHVDAAQSFGKEVDELKKLECDFLSISGHKIYGPKGIGALYARRPHGNPSPLKPFMFGGGQERGLRPGTLPVPLIVGLGKTAEFASQEHLSRSQLAKRVKDQFLAELEGRGAIINGDRSCCQHHVLNLTFPGVDSEALMLAIRESLAFSNGSACTSSSYKPSHVLSAMGLEESAIESSVRLSWSFNVDQIPTSALIQTFSSLSAT